MAWSNLPYLRSFLMQVVRLILLVFPPSNMSSFNVFDTLPPLAPSSDNLLYILFRFSAATGTASAAAQRCRTAREPVQITRLGLFAMHLTQIQC